MTKAAQEGMRVLGVGKMLRDIFSAEHLDVAALNFSANIHRLGVGAMLITGVGAGDRGAIEPPMQ